MLRDRPQSKAQFATSFRSSYRRSIGSVAAFCGGHSQPGLPQNGVRIEGVHLHIGHLFQRHRFSGGIPSRHCIVPVVPERARSRARADHAELAAVLVVFLDASAMLCAAKRAACDQSGSISREWHHSDPCSWRAALLVADDRQASGGASVGPAAHISAAHHICSSPTMEYWLPATPPVR